MLVSLHNTLYWSPCQDHEARKHRESWLIGIWYRFCCRREGVARPETAKSGGGVLFVPNIGEFPAVAHQVPKLADIRRRDKAPGNEVVLEDIRNPLGVFLVGFLSPNSLDVLRVGKHDIAGWLQNVVNGNPILP